MIGTPAFNPAIPGAIGGTTPDAITGTTITATSKFVAPDSTSVPGFTGSLGTCGFGVSAGGAAYVFVTGVGQAAEFASSISFFRSVAATNGLSTGISGVAFAPKVGGVIFDHFTDGASVSVDGTEDTLYTDTLSAGALNANGAKVSGYYQVAVVGHAVSTDRVRLYFGGTAIFDTAAINFPANAALTIRFEVIRVSSTVVRAAVSVTSTSATALPVSTYTEITGLTLSATQVIALKDISTGANSAVGDVTAKLGTINWQPAA